MTETVAPDCPDCRGEKRRKVFHKETREYHRVRCHCTYEDLPLKLVIQPENCGCALAAVATVVGKTYAEVRQYIHMDRDFTQQGTYDNEMLSLLEVFGYSYQSRSRWVSRLDAEREQWPCEPWADVHLCVVRNLPDTSYHMVVMLRDGRVLDPWWGVVQGLHRYSAVLSIHAVYPIKEEVPNAGI